MEIIDDNENNLNQNVQVSIKDERIKVIYHTSSDYLEGNMKYVSLHYLLTRVYDQLLKLNIYYTKSLSYNDCNVLIEHLPIVTYGVNTVKQTSIQIFFKKLTNIDCYFNEHTDNISKLNAHNLEKIIFTDLQLFLSYYNYHVTKDNIQLWRKVFRFMYQPIVCFKTIRNDRKVISEIERVFNIESKEDVSLIFFILGQNVY